jgi:hypothetical protein
MGLNRTVPDRWQIVALRRRSLFFDHSHDRQAGVPRRRCLRTSLAADALLIRRAAASRYFFAAPSNDPEAALLCPGCAAAGTSTVLHHDGGTPAP